MTADLTIYPMSANGSIGDSGDDDGEVPSKIDLLTRAVERVTNEVHSNTVAVGRMAGELSNAAARITSLEVTSRSFRQKLKSIPADLQGVAHDAAEDTARHEVEKLRAQLDREKLATKLAELEAERQSRLKSDAEVKRFAEDRRKRIWTFVKWALTVVGPPAGLFLEHYVHVLPK